MKFVLNLVRAISVIVLIQTSTTSLISNSRKYTWYRQPIQNNSKGRIFWDQLSSSGLVPVEINVQDTVTDLATGVGQMWLNAQEWWQEIQANAQRPRPDDGGDIIPVTDKLPIPNTIKKKKPGSLKSNIIDNKVQSIMSDEQEVQHQKIKKKKKKLKKKRIKKIIDYKNYMYFFMGLLGVWPTF